MAILKKIKSHPDVVDYFKELPFYNKDIERYWKYQPNREIEFTPVYFNSTTKRVINHNFSIENAFQEILYRSDNWINGGSGWIVELSLDTLTFQLKGHYQEVLM